MRSHSRSGRTGSYNFPLASVFRAFRPRLPLSKDPLTDRTTPRRNPRTPLPPPSPSDRSAAENRSMRAERRRLVEAAAEQHRLLAQHRRAWEAARLRRRLHAAQERHHAHARHEAELLHIQERVQRQERAVARGLRTDGLPEAERERLGKELAEGRRAAGLDRARALREHTLALEGLGTAETAAALLAGRRFAELESSERTLLDLQSQLSAHRAAYGDCGRRLRHAEARALRPPPAAPARPVLPGPRDGHTGTTGPGGAGGTGRDAVKFGESVVNVPPAIPPARASVWWLLPVCFFGLTAVLGVDGADAGAPLWVRVATRLVSLALAARLVRLWLPRRLWRTASPMPGGTGHLCWATLLALLATSMFVGPSGNTGAGWAAVAGAVALLVRGAARHRGD